MSPTQDPTVHLEQYGNPRFPEGIDDLNEVICSLPTGNDALTGAIEAALNRFSDIKVESRKDRAMQGTDKRCQVVAFCSKGIGVKNCRFAVAIPFRSDGVMLDRSVAIHTMTGTRPLAPREARDFVAELTANVRELLPTCV